MNKFRLGLGPMSHEIIVALGKISIGSPLMVIASRNQIDADSGYVCKSAELENILAPFKSMNLLLCRDHCGPYFLDTEKNLSEFDAIEATKKTIAKDIESGFDLIHIDTSRCSDVYKTAEDLIEFCIKLNPNILFEFGTEENIGVAAGIKNYKSDVKFAKHFSNMTYVVAQTGSLVMETRQAGNFDLETVKELVAFANDAGIGLKEHNADYLSAEQINLRKIAGVHALNIAPQLGVIQTIVTSNYCKRNNLKAEWNNFAQAVLNSGKWRKWHQYGNDNDKVLMAGHYLFRSDEYMILRDKIKDLPFLVEAEILNLFNHYEKNL